MVESLPQTPTDDASSALARGWVCYVTDPREAIRLADRVVAGISNEAQIGEAALLRGCALCLLGEFARGMEVLACRAELEPELPAPHQARRALLAWGIAAYRCGDTNLAFVLWDRARRASAEQNDPRLVGNALVQMGIALTEQGDIPRAVDRLLAALTIYQSENYGRGIAVTRGNLGNAMLQIGEYDKAAEHFLEGQRILEKLDDPRGRAVGRASLGRVQLKLGRLGEGFESIRTAAEEFQELGLRLEEAIALYHLGEAFLQRGEKAEAVGALRSAMALADATGASQYSLRARVVCAEALAAAGEVQEAAELLRRCLVDTRDPDRGQLKVNALMAVARLRKSRPGDAAWSGLPDEVAALEQVAASASDVSELSRAHAGLAEHFEQIGDAVHALRHYKEHLRFARLEAEESSKRTIARAEVELTVERLRRQNELAEENNRRLGEALDRAQHEHARAEEASRAKTMLMNILAHDLRSPLGLISLSAELLVHETDPDRWRSELGMIVLSAQRANRLVRSLVDGAAAEEGRLILRPVACDLVAIVQTLCRQLEVFAREKQQSLRVLGATTLPAVLDVQRVEQVVQNLVDNAIKFSTAGAVTEVELTDLGDRAVITVRDQGPGMSEIDLANAFTPFATRTAEPTGSESSTGLGLTITRKLVEAMGATIAVASEGVGRGCTFTLDLPTQAG